MRRGAETFEIMHKSHADHTKKFRKLQVQVAKRRIHMDIQELVRAQRAYFLSSATRPYAFRMEQLKKLQCALQTNEKPLEQAMYCLLYTSDAADE